MGWKACKESTDAGGKILNETITNDAFGCILSTMKLSDGGGGAYMFSHQICTDLKNGPDELQNH